jgi:hypothetical protein
VPGEQFQLYGFLALLLHPMAQKQESIATLPALGCSIALEVVPQGVQPFPQSSGLDQLLQLGKAFEKTAPPGF